MEPAEKHRPDHACGDGLGRSRGRTPGGHRGPPLDGQLALADSTLAGRRVRWVLRIGRLLSPACSCFDAEAELRSDDFSVRDETQERQLRYDQLRGYSLMESVSDGQRLHLLMLYPQSGRALSIGLPESVTDAQIHAYLSDHAPFVTIIDDDALKFE